MKELVQKLKETNRLEALDSLELLRKAAEELGFTEEDVMKFMEDFKGIPLDDDDTEEKNEITAEIIEQWSHAQSAEKAFALLKENGIELTEGQAEKMAAQWDKLHKNVELSGSDLEKVVGGNARFAGQTEGTGKESCANYRVDTRAFSVLNRGAKSHCVTCIYWAGVRSYDWFAAWNTECLCLFNEKK